MDKPTTKTSLFENNYFLEIELEFINKSYI